MQSSFDWTSVRSNLKTRLKRDRITTEALSHSSGVNRKTLDNFLHERSNLRTNTLKKIEDTLSLNLVTGEVKLSSASLSLAPTEFGSYSRDLASNYIGKYYVFRKSFDYTDGCVCSFLQISWHNDLDHMTFHETQRNTARNGRVHQYDLSGIVYIPHELSVLQFVSRSNGFNRISTLSTVGFGRSKKLKGVLVTLNEIRNVGFMPASSPMLAIKIDDDSTDAEILSKIGSMHVDECWRESLKEEFEEIEIDFTAMKT